MTVLMKAARLRNTTGYAITSAARFDGASWVSNTFSIAGDLTAWTVSLECQRAELSGYQQLFSAGVNTQVYFNEASNRFDWYDSGYRLYTSQVLRDPIGYMNLVFVYDSNNATASDRMRIYLNGERITSFSSVNYPALGSPSNWNNTTTMNIGKYTSGSQYYNGYLAEFQFIDGQVLDPTDFGELNSGNWEPIEYAGTYGNNGFYLKFDGDATDSSGNGNNWTENGTITYVTNTPTATEGLYSPLDAPTYQPLFGEGNTRVQGNTASQTSPAKSTLAFDIEDTDGFYFRVADSGGKGLGQNWNSIGIVRANGVFQPIGGGLNTADAITYYESGRVLNQGTQVRADSSTWDYGQTDYIDVFVKNGSIWFGLNGTWDGDPVAGTGASVTSLTGQWQLISMLYATTSVQRWTATDMTNAPTGAKSLTVANITPNAITSGTSIVGFNYTGGVPSNIVGPTVTGIYATGFTASNAVAFTCDVDNPIGGTIMPRGQAN